MEKVFEDYFSELQGEIVAICAEYADYKADGIYIYCSYEDKMYSFNVFYKMNGKVVHKHRLNETLEEGQRERFDVSRERQRSMLKIGLGYLEEIHKKCQEFNRDMPTEIKIHYNAKENKLRARYQYDPVWSDTKELAPPDIFISWFEEVKKANQR
ncbi:MULTISPECIES: hypothetical protein [Thermoactinomyces]|jgi:hypothetical protein|uniref:hypothetical protein n=1 Tax=Thermoactinomyces TaxID=2023 RepID=UPI000503313D|nr:MULTISPECIES: hypothetical protein [Thermoactinomyces]KFZ40026.1 hypothetical protein JS81_09985 [Thermoactinomyces sp. Gus2-1]MBH8587167.1 DUF600 domain-containing protein [Thermoactinomyces sp. CICC 10520]QCV56461.1 DUF600 domain-containing protein [Thermoactinomyces vulgaris]